MTKQLGEELAVLAAAKEATPKQKRAAATPIYTPLPLPEKHTNKKKSKTPPTPTPTKPKPTITTPTTTTTTQQPSTPTKGGLLLLQKEWKEEKAALLLKVEELEQKNVELAMKAARLEGQLEIYKSGEELRQKELDRVWSMIKK